MKAFIDKYQKWIYAFVVFLAGVSLLLVMEASVKANPVLTKIYSIEPYIDLSIGSVRFNELKGHTYVEEFSTDSTFHGFSLSFRADGDKISGKTIVKLTEKGTDNVLLYSEVDNEKVDKNSLVDFYLDVDNRGDANKIYVLEVSGDENTSGISLYTNNIKYFDGSFLIDNKEMPNANISLGTFQKTNRIKSLYKMITILMIIGFFCVVFAFTLFYKKLHIVALIAVIVFGSLYMMFFMPGKCHDSAYHYTTIYNFTNQIFGIKLTEGENERLYLHMSDDDYKAYQKCFVTKDPYKSGMCADAYLDLIDCFNLKRDNTGDNLVYIITGNRHILPYIPYIVGMVLGRIISLGAVPTILLSEFVALLTFAFLIMLSVKIAPIGKEIILTAALVPICIQQFACISYDGMSIALSFVFIGLWLNYMYGNLDVKASRKYIIYMGLCLLGLLFCKGGIYLLLGMLLMPAVIKKIPKKYFFMGVGAVLLLAIVLILTRYRSMLNGLFNLNNEVYNIETGGYEYRLVLKEPVTFLKMLTGALIEKLDYYMRTAFTMHINQKLFIIPMSAFIPLVILMFFLSMKESEEAVSMSKSVKGIIFGILVVFTLVMGLLLLPETPHGWNINGMDGRYYLPFLPLIFLLFRGNGIIVKGQSKIKMLALFGIAEMAVCFYILWYVMSF